MFRHILVPLDGSQFSETAVPAVVELASRFGSKVTLIVVIQTPTILAYGYGPGYADLLITLRKEARREAVAYLEKHRRWLKAKGLNVQVKINEMEPVADAILNTVEATHADTIVMSTHGRGGVRRWVYGSVADRVLRHATVPVLLIRPNDNNMNWQKNQEEVVDQAPELKPEEESADVLERMVQSRKEPTMAERLIDEHMVDRPSR